MNADSKTLVSSQHKYFRDKSGLDVVLRAISDKGPGTKTALVVDKLAEASQRLDDFLPSAWMDAMELLKHLQDSTLARQITEDAAEQFCADFEQLVKAVVETDSGPGDEPDKPGELRAAFPRTSAEIRVRLS